MDANTSNQPIQRIPTLDGWRGIAILMVLSDHLQRSFFLGPYGGHEWLMTGQHGVTLFFVLSGYLITSRLLSEPKIDLKSFYIRRFFRLMPCAWTYLLALWIVGIAVHATIVGSDAWSCLFFVRNYIPWHESATNMRTGHFWSLSIEEQFYLAWPPLLALLGRKRSPWLAVSGIVLCAAYRYHFWHQYSGGLVSQHTEVRIDALLYGCVFAILLRLPQLRRWIAEHSHFILLFAFPLAIRYIYCYQSLIPTGECRHAGAVGCVHKPPFDRLSEPGAGMEASEVSRQHLLWPVCLAAGNALYSSRRTLGALALPLVVISSYGVIERPVTF